MLGVEIAKFSLFCKKNVFALLCKKQVNANYCTKIVYLVLAKKNVQTDLFPKAHNANKLSC